MVVTRSWTQRTIAPDHLGPGTPAARRALVAGFDDLAGEVIGGQTAFGDHIAAAGHTFDRAGG